jgi:hypothetical protein
MVKEFTMIAQQIGTSQLPVELEDGLILRRSRPEDAEVLTDFNSRVHSDEGFDKPDERIAAWTNDLMVIPHPTFTPYDFTIVEEATTGKIVSSMNLISQTWTYAGIPFRVGRPELVGTMPGFRNRGLVRRQFDVIHRWSAEKGEKVQAITGIPYYYRLFGYEMAMNLSGGRSGFPTHIPRLKDGESEPYQFRLATDADIPLISELYNAGCKRSLVACEWDETKWHYELSVKNKKNVNRSDVRVIETPDGRSCGFIIHPFFSWGDMMVVQWYEISPDLSWNEVTPSVIRYIEAAYEQFQPEHGEKKPFGAFGFWLGEDHPVYHVIPAKLPHERKPYAWYLRLVDIADFLRHVSSKLEMRLDSSCFSGYSGELRLSFYRDGLCLNFSKGKLISIEKWQPVPSSHDQAGHAAFPPHTFLQLLFGYRTMDMLKGSFADCWTARDEIHALLDILFPRQPSDLWPIS